MHLTFVQIAAVLPLVVVAYWATRGRARLWFLVGASYAFYASWDWRICALLLLTTAVDFQVARALETVTDAPRRRRLLLVSVAVDLGVLAAFKYFAFFSTSLVALATGLGLGVPAVVAQVVVPVGMSFYTFKSLGHVFDVYYGGRAEPDSLRYATFVAFFPQLLAGPIARGEELLPQLRADRPLSADGVLSGVGLVSWGLFKKIAVADSLGSVVDGRFAEPGVHSALSLAIGVYFYAFQIYCDFSGYTDVAIGVSRIMGFETRPNFDRPYASASVAEFWTRWHISLSTWLRDFVFRPLQFRWRRLGPQASALAVMVTFLASGLWHGTGWTFVAWGLLHGAALALAVYARPFERWAKRGSGRVRVAVRAVGVALTFHFVCLSFILFRSPDFATAAAVLRGLSRLDGVLAEVPLVFLVPKGLLLIGLVVAVEWAGARPSIAARAARSPIFRLLAPAALAWAVALFGTFEGQRFIYSRF